MFYKSCIYYKPINEYSITCVKRPLSIRLKTGFQDQSSLNAGQQYCRMLQGEHSAILSTFIKLPFVFKIFVLSVFEWPFYTGFFTVLLFFCISSRISLYFGSATFHPSLHWLPMCSFMGFQNTKCIYRIFLQFKNNEYTFYSIFEGNNTWDFVTYHICAKAPFKYSKKWAKLTYPRQ